MKNEYLLAKAVLQWLVSIKILSTAEADAIDELNRKVFRISTGLMS